MLLFFVVFCFPNAAHTISKSTNRANARIKIGHAKTDDSEQCSTVEQPSSRMALTIDGVGLFQKLIGQSFGSLPSSPLADEEETIFLRLLLPAGLSSCLARFLLRLDDVSGGSSAASARIGASASLCSTLASAGVAGGGCSSGNGAATLALLVDPGVSSIRSLGVFLMIRRRFGLP